MAKKVGIFVTTEEHLEHLLGLCRAAKKAGDEVSVFLTSRAVLLTQQPGFEEMAELCPEVSLCNVGFDDNKLTKPVPVVKDENFATQMRHGIMVEDCERYISL